MSEVFHWVMVGQASYLVFSLLAVLVILIFGLIGKGFELLTKWIRRV